MSLFEVNSIVSKPDADLIAQFSEIPTSILSDAMGNLHTMDSGIQMVVEADSICGSAVTVSTRAGDFLSVLKALEMAEDGDVLVVDSQARPDTANWGELTTIEAQGKGVRGLVVDGLVRDIAEISALKFPVFARGTTPRVAGRNNLGEVNVAIHCGGVSVSPGDIVIGDQDGVVIVPGRKASEVLSGAEAILELEAGLRKRIQGGETQVNIFELDQLRRDMLKSLSDNPV